jgi:hypothetical protein
MRELALEVGLVERVSVTELQEVRLQEEPLLGERQSQMGKRSWMLV